MPDTFLDSSYNALTVTASGNVAQGSVSPFYNNTTENYSVCFDGVGDYLSVPDNVNLDLGLSGQPFTIELWFNQATTGNAVYYNRGGGFAGWNSTNGHQLILSYSSGILYAQIWNGSSLVNLSSSANLISPNGWYHLALSYDGSTSRLFLNGVIVASGTVSYGKPTSSNLTRLGTSVSGENYNLVYLSNFRIVKGTAVYTSSFTPPTTKLTAITNTVLLTCQDSTIKDNSTNNFTLTRVGDVGVDTFSPFILESGVPASGEYSAYFDGVGDYVTTSNSTRLGLGLEAFTIECWAYPTSNPANGPGTIIDARSGSTIEGYVIRVFNDRKVGIFTSTGAYVYSTGTVTLNSWNHIALVRNSTAANGSTFYINGQPAGNITVSSNLGSSWAARIGSNYAGTGYEWYGYISGLRVVKGSALYTTTFTPPTARLTAVANTSLLTFQTNKFEDESGNNLTLTATGDASVALVSPFELPNTFYSHYYNGTTYSSLPNDTKFDLGLNNEPFTIECWFNPPSTTAPTNSNICLIERGGGVSGWNATNGIQFTLFHFQNDRQVYFRTWNGSAMATVTTTGSVVSAGGWNHIAVCYNGTTTNIYINGVNQTAGGNTIGYAKPTNSSITRIGNHSVASTQASVYITNFRILKGTCLYTANFTMPAGPLQAITNTVFLGFRKYTTKDDSVNNFTITNSSGVYTEQQAPGNLYYGYDCTPTSNGSWSAYFDGTGDYLTVASSNNFAFGTGNFTIEFWIYRTVDSVQQNLIDCRPAAAGQTAVLIYITAANVLAYYDGNAGGTDRITSSANAVPKNTWCHIAFCRNGGNSRLFVNGVQVGSTYGDANSFPARQLLIGARWDGTASFLTGYLSNLRIVRNTGLYYANFTPPAGPLKSFNYTSFIGLQSNRLVDTGPFNFSITRNGDVYPTTFSPFTKISGFFSVNFPATGDYLSLADSSSFDLGINREPFTLEFWSYLSINNDTYILNRGGGTGAWNSTTGHQYMVDYTFFGGTVNFKNWTGSALNTISVPSALIKTGTWFHLAVSYDGTTTKLFFNGTVVATGTQTYAKPSSSNLFRIGASVSGETNKAHTISNLRIVKGTALYTTDFTAITAPLAPVMNTVLLAAQDSFFRDNSQFRRAITNTGNVKVVAESPFNPTTIEYKTSLVGGSASFDGNGDLVSVADNALFTMGSGDFTVECWVYSTLAGSVQYILGQVPSSGTAATTSFQVYKTAANKVEAYVYAGSAKVVTSTSNLPLYSWTHIAMVRSGVNLNLFLNGVLEATNSTLSTTALVDSTGSFSVGRTGDYAGSYFKGNVADVRVIKGRAAYKANFHPPIQPLTSTANTSLLLNFKNAGIVDQSKKGNVELIGSVAKNSTVKKYGNNSLYFPGTASESSYLKIQNAQMDFGVADFTIECWLYPASVSTSWSTGSLAAIMDLDSSAVTGTADWFGLFQLNDTIVFQSDNRTIVSSSGCLTANNWTHIAVVRTGDTFKIYANGTLVGTGTYYVGVAVGSIRTLYIGQQSGVSSWYKGYIDEIRVSKGLARYTSNFTPDSFWI